jgi:hypothetical protein
MEECIAAAAEEDLCAIGGLKSKFRSLKASSTICWNFDGKQKIDMIWLLINCIIAWAFFGSRSHYPKSHGHAKI